MDLAHLIFLIAVIAVIWVCIRTWIPLPAPAGTIIGIVFAVILILAVLSFFGLKGFGF